jgi:hypothetical protein
LDASCDRVESAEHSRVGEIEKMGRLGIVTFMVAKKVAKEITRPSKTLCPAPP